MSRNNQIYLQLLSWRHLDAEDDKHPGDGADEPPSNVRCLRLAGGRLGVTQTADQGGQEGVKILAQRTNVRECVRKFERKKGNISVRH